MRPRAIHLIAAARPNFMKIAPLYHALHDEGWCRPLIVHTGQHYDPIMSDAFFQDLRLPAPDTHLGTGGATHAEQTARVMIAYEQLCLAQRPDWVVVVGDVNSTMACAITAKKLELPVAHLEAGLRSGDRTMPEEINRLATDAISDLLWTPSIDADENLLREGHPPEQIVRVGNIMIDSYELMKPAIEARHIASSLGLEAGAFGVVTLHRPSNVDNPDRLSSIIREISAAARQLPLVFPIHPRTTKRLQEFGLQEALPSSLRLVPPLGYVDFMSLVGDAKVMITDSGGIQEETTYLGIPCLTLRENTERPITVTQGTNQLLRPEQLLERLHSILEHRSAVRPPPELWDGRTARRIAASLKAHAIGE
jgi:UDP-N-acetylglucosamine 2-epimerase (non-hydrolysing)